MDIAERVLQLKTDFKDVYYAGINSEYDAFWDGVQDYGRREQYRNAFFQWRNEYIRPKYKIMPSKYTSYGMFESCENLKIIEKEYFDFSNYTPSNDSTSNRCWYYTFSNCKSIEIFYDLGLKAGGYVNTWRFCRNLHTIEIMRCCEDGVYSTPFYDCTKLKNIEIEGEIGESFPIPDSPLTTDSLKSIITHLKDFSGIGGRVRTLTVKASAFEELEAEGATAEYNGVPCTWAELIDNKEWNLVKA